jgi:hypothetical protein
VVAGCVLQTFPQVAGSPGERQVSNKKNPTYFLVGGASVSSILLIAASLIIGALLAVGLVVVLAILKAWRMQV